MSATEVAETASIVAAARAALRAAVAECGAPLHATQLATEFEPQARALVDAVLAVKYLAEAVKQADTTLRARLRDMVMLTGLPVHTHNGVAEVHDGSRSAIVTDASLIPTQYMRPAAPDLTKLAVDLRKGIELSGCVLGNGGAPVLTVRAKKAAATTQKGDAE